MNDEKRLLRKLKKEVKQQGNKKRRRFLKDLHADPEDFAFGRENSAAMNEPRGERSPVRRRKRRDHERGVDGEAPQE